MESKILYSLIKYPFDAKNNCNFDKRRIFIKNENNEITELQKNLVDKYEKVRKEISENKEDVLNYISRIELLKPEVRSLLQNDVERIAENDVESYLSETELNSLQFHDVMTNAEKLVDSYKNGMHKMKELEEAGQRVEELLKSINNRK